MERLILLLLVIGEFGFLFWTIKTQNCNKKVKGFWKLGFFAILCLLLLVGVLEETTRYGMIIAVLFVQAIIGLLRSRWGKTKVFKKGRAIGCFVGNSLIYFLALIPAFLFPQYKPLPVTGSLQVETAMYTFKDENRVETFSEAGENRFVTVKLWYPEEDGSYPLVLFSHGAFGVIDSNYSAYMELASHGYVVASIGHPYHSMFLTDTTGKTTMVSMEFMNQINTMNSDDLLEGQTPEDKERDTYQLSRKWLALRTGDMNFILDTLVEKADAKEVPFSRIDKDKIGLFGHSLGGATSVQLGRERTDIDAVIDLEGTMFGEIIGFEQGADVPNPEPYPIPLLDINSKEIHELAMEVPGDGYINFYVGARALCYQEVIFKDAGHLNFTDLPVISPPLAGLLGMGTVEARECIENVNSVVLNFFDYYLKGEGTLNLEKEY